MYCSVLCDLFVSFLVIVLTLVLSMICRRLCLALNDALHSSWRSQWVRPRSKVWWNDAISGWYGADWWKINFRMSRDVFNVLCSSLRPYIERQMCVRECVSVEQCAAVTLYKLATNVEYRTLSNLFGLGKSTVCTIVVETCQVIASKLLPKYFTVPRDEKLKEVVQGF